MHPPSIVTLRLIGRLAVDGSMDMVFEMTRERRSASKVRPSPLRLLSEFSVDLIAWNLTGYLLVLIASQVELSE